jgi:hypothetical protein
VQHVDAAEAAADDDGVEALLVVHGVVSYIFVESLAPFSCA